jgi:hypothetical protein
MWLDHTAYGERDYYKVVQLYLKMNNTEEEYINAKKAVDNIINFVGTTIGLILFIASLLNGKFLIALGIFFGGWILVLIARIVLTTPLTLLYAYLYSLYGRLK